MPPAPLASTIPRLILAPLLGVTTAVFRRVFQNHFPGFNQAMAPFLSVTHGKLPPTKYFKDIQPANNRDSMPLVPQLIGKDGADFREMANRIHDEFGYKEVNWNIGCPSPTVTSRIRGAGLLAYPDRIAAFLDAACSGLACQISIKMRLGMEQPQEYLQLVDILNAYPISEITIHPRTGRQLYTGFADVESFADLKSRLHHRIIYNGDISNPVQARALIARFPDLAGLMIGRGAIANPWLARSIRKGDSAAPGIDLALLSAFHNDLYETYCQTMEGGAGPVLGKMKEIWSYWTPEFGENAVRRVLKAKNFPEYEQAVNSAFIVGKNKGASE